MGYKENVTLSSIQTYLAMDSNDEYRYELEREEQERIQRAEVKRRQAEIAKKRAGGGSGHSAMSLGPSSYTPSTPTPVVQSKPRQQEGIHPLHPQTVRTLRVVCSSVGEVEALAKEGMI